MRDRFGILRDLGLARPSRIVVAWTLGACTLLSAFQVEAAAFSARALYFDVGTGVSSLAVGDVDGDGRTDYVAPNGTLSYAIAIFWGEGDGTYGSRLNLTTGASPKGMAIADLDGDGRRDIAVANFGSGSVSVFLSTGLRTFGPRQDYPVGTNPASVTAGDINGDGLLDLVTANQNVSGSVS